PRAGQSALRLIRVHKLTHRPSTATPTKSADRLIYLATLPAWTLYSRRALNEMGNPREGEGRPDRVSLAHHEIRGSEVGVPVRAARKGLGRREGTERDTV